MEVVDFLFAFAFFGCPIADLRQRFVGIWVDVFETGGMLQRVGMGQQVARFVVGIAVITAFRIAFTDQAVAVVIVEMQDGAVGADDGLNLSLVAVLIAGNAPHRIGMAEQTAQTVAFHQMGAAVGKHPFGQLVVVVVMILLSTAQHVSHLGITVVIGKAPFLAQGGPVAQHLAGYFSRHTSVSIFWIKIIGKVV